MLKFSASLCVISLALMCADAYTDYCGLPAVARKTNGVVKGFGNGSSLAKLSGPCLNSINLTCTATSQQSQDVDGNCACGYIIGTELSSQAGLIGSASVQALYQAILHDGFTQDSVAFESGIGSQKGLGVAISCANNGQDKAWVQKQLDTWAEGETLSGATKTLKKSYKEYYKL